MGTCSFGPAFGSLALSLAAAWTPLYPHRDADIGPIEHCTTDRSGALAAEAPVACSRTFAEINDSGRAEGTFRYTLYFIEFDDQGWTFPAAHDGRSEMDRVLAALRDRLGKAHDAVKDGCVSGDGKVNLILYVHGWKHDASANGSNVMSFRQLLREVAVAECNGAGYKREVVGIYVGWRGRSLDLPEPLIDMSFWDRKSTAIDVAQGSVRELFARLDAIVDGANGEWLAHAKVGAATVQSKPVRMLFIGHSFGGHILLTALGGSIIRNLAAYDEHLDGKERDGCIGPRLQRDGDMVVVVNPAIEASRFEPLFAIARNWRYRCYRAPMFVSVTSKADKATKIAFPIGRLLSTLFESYTSESEKQADRRSLGHDRSFITHELGLRRDFNVALPQPIEECANWDPRGNLVQSILAEYHNERTFASSILTQWNPVVPRAFCGGTILVPLSGLEWRAPILNISASKSLIADHSDIYGPAFVSFIRELYMDSLIPSFQLRAPPAR